MQEISANDNLLELILNTMQNPVSVKNINGQLLFANKAFTDLLGVRAEDYNKNIEKKYIRNDIDCNVIINKETIKTIESFTDLNGDSKRFWSIKQPIEIANDQIAILTVLTEAVDDEYGTSQKYKKITGRILNNIPVGIFAKNMNGQFVFFNNEYSRIAGVTKEWALGRSAFDIFDIDTAKKITADDEAAIRSNRLSFAEETLVLDGKEICLHTGRVPMDITKNERILLGFSIDISDRKLLEERLRIVNESLVEAIEEQIDESKRQEAIMAHQSRLAIMGEMINNIAHQWKQPLNAVGVMAQELKMACSLGITDQKYIGDIIEDSINQIKYMSNTIDDFRNFFSPNKKKTFFTIESVVLKASSFLSGVFKNNNIFFSVKDVEDVNIYGYENEFLQVLLNVLSNSKDALIENKIADPHIIVSIRKVDSYGILKIEDNGGGIRKDVLERVFEPYFTTKEFDKGSGIGLYMSKMIIEEHMQGELSIASSGGNTTVTIKLKSNV